MNNRIPTRLLLSLSLFAYIASASEWLDQTQRKNIYKIHRVITEIEEHGFIQCGKDDAEIILSGNAVISDTLPNYSIEVGYKRGVNIDRDTDTYYHFLPESPGGLAGIGGSGKSFKGVNKDGGTLKDGKFFGYGIYDSFYLEPSQSDSVLGVIRGTIIPWGLGIRIPLEHEFKSNASDSVIDSSGGIKRIYRIEFIRSHAKSRKAKKGNDN